MKNEALKKVLTEQRFAVLATHDEGQPHGSLVAFAVSGDFRNLYFATIRETRKYSNMARDPRVALVADDRMNRESDLTRAVAVTAAGEAREITGKERAEAAAVFLSRHGGMKDFLENPRCALMKVSVAKYFVVSEFGNVAEEVPAP